MPRYKVIVTRDATESVVLDVVAKNEAHAEAVALREAELNQGIKWTLDDDNFHRPYTNGVAWEIPLEVK